MKLSNRTAAIIGVACGAELVAAIVIGGAGLGALFGWNGAVLAVVTASLITATIYQRRQTNRGP